MPKLPTSEVLKLATRDLACFAVAMWPGFQLARHHRVIVEKLEAVERGEITRLMIFMPPRHGKSLLSTQLFPSWYLGRHPDRGVVVASYGQSLADDFGRKVRNFVNEPLFGAIFPACRMSEDSRALDRFTTTRDGTFFSVGVGAALTGRGCSLLVIDDPIKDSEEARSEATRRGLREWYSNVGRTRLTPGGAIIVIETRWHESDLAGQLLEQAEEDWTVLSLAAIAETDEDFRRAGEALWPERFPVEVLDLIRREVGPATWASLYQQRPSAIEGQIFKRESWQYFDTAPELKRIVLSVDSAFKTGSTNDFSVVTVWGEGQVGFYLLGMLRERMEFPRLKQRLMNMDVQWWPDIILVEDCASGQSLLQELKTSTSLPIRAVRPDSDKVSRAVAVTPLLEAGRVFLPSGAPWLDVFLDELSGFPNSAYDDITDTVSQALNYFRGRRGPEGLIEYYARQTGSQEPQDTENNEGTEPAQPAVLYSNWDHGTPLRAPWERDLP